MLAIYATGSIGYYLCLFMQTQFQLGSYIHVCTGGSSKSTRFNPYFCSNNYRQQKLATVDLLENVLHLCIHGCNYPAGIVLA